MITNNTVFILGAGSSVPFSFPIGTGLVEDIIKNISHKYGGKFGSFLIPKMPEVFSYNLNHSTLDSIDAFLEHKSGDIHMVRMGKLCIALSILRCESNTQYLGIGNKALHNHWLRYLRNKMNSPVDNFSENQVSFITFNYDRTLENYLYTSILSTYGLPEKESKELMSSFEIVHIHGVVAPLPWQVTDGTGLDFGFDTGIVDEGHIGMFASNLKIVHEDIDPNNLEKAKELMDNADIIYVLGFGYAAENCDRLKLNRDELKNKIKGTAFGKTDQEISESIRLRTKVEILDPGYSNFEFLRNVSLT